MTEGEAKANQSIELAERLKKRFANSSLVGFHDINKFVVLFLTTMEEMEKMRRGA